MARAGDSWPSFQNGGRVSLEIPADRPQQLAPSTEEWSAELPGSGQSSPIIWNETVYTTSATGPNKETYHVVAVSLADGNRLWTFDVPNPSPVEDGGYVSRAAPTAAADENGVVALFEGGLIVALSHAGELRWQRNLVEEFGSVASRHGLSASLEQTADLTFVWVERAEDPYLLGLEKQTGEIRWKIPGIGATSWASPRLIPVDGGRHLVLSAIGSLTGLDPASGERLWTLEGLSGNSTPTPVPLGGGRMLVGATDGRGESDAGGNARTNGVVEVRRTAEGGWQAEYVWRSAKATCSFGSPLAHRGQAYIVNRTGVVHCFDLATGELHYAERIPGSIWATPVGLGNSVMMFCKDGPQAVLAAGPEFQLLAATETPEAAADDSGTARTVYGIAVAGNAIVTREGDRLRRFALVGVK